MFTALQIVGHTEVGEPLFKSGSQRTFPLKDRTVNTFGFVVSSLSQLLSCATAAATGDAQQMDAVYKNADGCALKTGGEPDLVSGLQFASLCS